MLTSANVRSLVRSIAPAPVRRLAQSVLTWKRGVRFHPYVMTKSVQGFDFPFYIGDTVAHAWYGGGNGRSPELGFVRDKMMAPGDLVFDVGAHHCLVTAAVAPLAACVVAVEPNPHNVAFLRKNRNSISSLWQRIPAQSSRAQKIISGLTRGPESWQ